MQSVVLGLLAGLYVGNPNFRSTVDTAIKKALGHGIDMLNNRVENVQVDDEVDEDE